MEMTFLPPAPRVLSASMKRNAFINLLVSMGAGVVSLMFTVVLWSMGYQDGREVSIAWTVVAASAVSILAALVVWSHIGRERRLWIHGCETHGRYVTRGLEIAYVVGSTQIVRPVRTFDHGSQAGRGLVLADPRRPRAAMGVTLAMLPPELIEARPLDGALLPSRPRPSSPNWRRRWRPWPFWGAALLAAGVALLLIGGSASDRLNGLSRSPILTIAGLAMLASMALFGLGLRAFASRMALWRTGVEAHAEIVNSTPSGMWLRVRVGDVTWEGGRASMGSVELRTRPGSNRVVVLIDPANPEDLQIVLAEDLVE